MRLESVTIKTLYKPAIVLVALAMLLLTSAWAARAESDSITAKFLYDLSGTDIDSGLNAPRDVFVDHHSGEVFVADGNNDRIRIYNDRGMQIYEFGSTRALRRPKSVVVDSKGIIYVLHSKSGKPVVSLFNFRGVYQGRLSFEGLPMDVPLVRPTALAIDRQDNIYVVDDQTTIKRILVFDPEGKFSRAFQIMTDLDEKETEETFAGKLCVAPDGNIYIPNPVVGMVYVYSREGGFIHNIGHKGGGAPGTLNFPVDVEVDDFGRVLVLDKTLSSVIVYDTKGTHLGQFGGRGSSYGWFIWPNSIALDEESRVYVAQVPGNRLQVMQLSRPGKAYMKPSLESPFEKGGERQTTLVGSKDVK
jgi:DNA-binding beta-propeller fold protein YncE